MSNKTNTTCHNFHNNIVSVIASFDSEGHVKPLYVRINENSLKVHSSWLKPSFQGFLEFQCNVIENNCLKPLLLTYHKRENVWTIPHNV